MPTPLDYRDHPELYQEGDFRMEKEKLLKKLPSNCKLLIGSVEETIPIFLKETDLYDAPIGFISFDLDYYSSTKIALSVLKGPENRYLAKLPLYFDDIALWSHNSKSGELLAITELNSTNNNRLIEMDMFTKSRRIFKTAEWLNHIYYLHVLDSSIRKRIVQKRESAILKNPYL
jgi:hypothetical protein